MLSPARAEISSRLASLLRCPRCAAELTEVTGDLSCSRCERTYPVIDGVPRFTHGADYADSFGLQWNKFREEQLDSHNRTTLSERRFLTETGWTREWLRGKRVLDAGCGAGRFAEIAASYGAHVVAVDVSSAVKAAQRTLDRFPDAEVAQASITELPFEPGSFDAVYCIGVAQHTPDPVRTIAALPPMLKPGGRLAVTVYERRRFTRFNGKYLLRPLTRRLPPALLAGLIRGTMPVLFPLTELLFRLPGVGRLFRFAIPVANYAGAIPLNLRERYRWALLDTLDMLGPGVDKPLTEAELRSALPSYMIDVRRQSPTGLNMVARRQAAASRV